MLATETENRREATPDVIYQRMWAPVQGIVANVISLTLSSEDFNYKMFT